MNEQSDLRVEHNLLHEALASFAIWGEKTALIEKEGAEISFTDLRDRIIRLSAKLTKMGLKRGDTVYLLIPVNIELYITICAILKLGARVAFIDPWASRAYISKCLEKTRPQMMIYVKKARFLSFYIEEIRAIAKKCEQRALMEGLSTYPYSADDEKVTAVDKEDTALITFTTGSTHNPKGTDRPHALLYAQYLAHKEYYGHQQHDVDLVQFVVFALSNLASGMTSVLADVDLRHLDKVNPKRIVEQIERHQITSLTCSPAFIIPVLDYCLQEKKQLPSLLKLFVGGAPVPPSLFEKAKKVFDKEKGARQFLVYGSSEAEPIAFLEGQEVLLKSKEKTLRGEGVALGRLVPGLRCRLLPVHGVNTVLGIKQEVGEIVLTGDFVGKRYFQNKEAFKENKIVDENGTIWHRTGDIAYCDEDGIYYMLGRIHSLINMGGTVVFPLQLEPVLAQLSFIKKSAFIQTRGEQGPCGLLLVECKKIKSELTHAEKEKRIRTLIDKVPALLELPLLEMIPQIKFLDHIPVDKRHQSKIDYKEIQKQYGVLNMSKDESSAFSADNIEALKKKNLATRLWAYTKERFPLPAILLFSGVLAFNVFYLTQMAIWGGLKYHFSFSMLTGFLTIFLVFFHLRIFDEVKDFNRDKKVYPRRLLSQGVISISELKKLGMYIIGAEAILNIMGGLGQFFWWTLVLIYSLLMLKEFFYEKLKDNIELYLFSHQVLVPIMVLYLMKVLAGQIPFAYLVQSKFLGIFLVITIIQLSYEIARKTWSLDRENVNADSYSRAWGIPRACSVLLGLFILLWVINVFYIEAFHLGMSGLLLSGIIFGVSAGAVGLFWRRPTYGHSKLLENIVSITSVANHLLMIVLILLREVK